jgi:adenylate cyclase
VTVSIEPPRSRSEARRNPRRRVAILYADAAGFTQLASREEDWTLGALTIARERFAAAIAPRGGRVVATPGDAVLAEFASAADAVVCAIDAQRQFSWKPLISPQGQLLQFRIGLHLAGIFDDGADILGDGVNVAARITEMAEPGGIWVSAGIYEQVRDKLDLLCSDLGEVMLRSMEQPARLYRIDVAAESDAQADAPEVRRGSVHLVAYRPSVAVLPFSNLAGDSADDHVVEGITDTLINALACSRWFYVIARSSSFRLRSSALSVREMGRVLGARYVVQGSFQRDGRNVRVTTHFIEAASEKLLHSDRFEGSFVDAFSMQDAIAMRIAAAVEPGVMSTEAAKEARPVSANPSALDRVLRAYSRLWEMTPQGLTEAVVHLRAAVAADDTISQAHAGLALAAIQQVYMGWADDPQRQLETAHAAATHAIRLDRADAWAHVALGNVYMQTNEVEQAIAMLRTAIRLNPSLALAYGFLAHAMIFAGRLSEAQTLLRLAIRLSPRDFLLAYWLDGLSMVHLMGERFHDAVYWAQRTTQENPHWPGGFRVLAIVHAHLGDREAARKALTRMLELQPNFSLDYIRRIWPFHDPAFFEANMKGLRAAGWTDTGAVPA